MRKGLTLIELLVSVSAIAIVATLIAQVFFTTIKVNRATISGQEIKQNGEFALDFIERTIRSSREYAFTCDLGATSTESAAFVNPDLGVTTIKCVSDGTAARIASVSANGTSYLTANSMTLSSSGDASCTYSTLLFSCDALNGTGPIAVNFTLIAKGVGVDPSNPEYQKFETSVQSRNVVQ